jgi:EmrB/QacA subfamily drug resistance transporter
VTNTKDRSDHSVELAVLFTVGLGGMLIPLNSTMVAVAIPTITKQLHASVTASGWLVTAYLIVMAAFQPISGKLGDRYGRRVFLLGGYTVFGLSSFAAAVSPNIQLLIVCRAGQALAGSVIFPNGSALLRQIVPEERRGARFGLLGSSIAFGAAIGPSLGGFLLETGDWPAIFWVNLPLCVVVVLIALRTIPSDRIERAPARFDFLGSAMLAIVLTVGAWLLTRLDDISSTVAIPLGVGSAVMIALFVRHELAHPDPVVQPRFFKRRAFVAAVMAIALSNVGLYVLLLIVPFMLNERPGWSEAKIGLVLTSMSAGMVLLAPIGGRLSDRLGRRTPATAGMLLLALGVTAFALIGPEVSGALLVPILAVSGIGIGLGAGSLQTSAIESIETEHAGMAAGVSMTSRYLGSIAGAAFLAGVVASGKGLDPVLWMTAVAAIAAVGFAFALPAHPAWHREQTDPEEVAPV